MIVASASIACVADIGYDFAAMRKVSFRKAIGIMIKVRVVVNGSVVWVELIDGRPARLTLKEFDDATIGGGQDGRAVWSGDVYRIVRATLRARFAERIAQLVGANSGDRD